MPLGCSQGSPWTPLDYHTLSSRWQHHRDEGSGAQTGSGPGQGAETRKERLSSCQRLACPFAPYLNGREMSALHFLMFLINQFRCLGALAATPNVLPHSSQRTEVASGSRGFSVICGEQPGPLQPAGPELATLPGPLPSLCSGPVISPSSLSASAPDKEH